MKLDYKLPLKKMGWLPNRLRIRLALGSLALLCLSFSLYHREPASSVSQPIAKIENASVNETPSANLAKSNFEFSPKIDLNDVSEFTESLSETSLAQEKTPDSTSKKNQETAKPAVLEKSPSVVASKNDPEKNWRMVTVKKGDTLAKIFKRYGYSKKDLQEILDANPKHKKQLASLKAHQTIKLLLTPQKHVQGLTLDLQRGKTLTLANKAMGVQVAAKQTEIKPEPVVQQPAQQPPEQQLVEKQLAFGKGKIRDSLFSAGKRAGLDHNVISQMVDIFGWNIDFSLDLQPNDSFRVLFEEKRQDGERVGTGAILAAEIVNQGKKHQAIRYTDKSGRTGYFSPDGNGMRQAFLPYPVNFTRISSGFGKRLHPVHKRIKNHTGIDYSAPSGTPVQATGDAKVIFVGNRGGYGRVIELQHGARYSTLYAHLSRFAKNLKTGAEVKQGQIIGYVGRTGLATGDHLHYEFRVDGIHRNPHTIDVPKKSLIPSAHKGHFLAHAKEMLRLMDLHENKISVVRNEYPRNE